MLSNETSNDERSQEDLNLDRLSVCFRTFCKVKSKQLDFMSLDYEYLLNGVFQFIYGQLDIRLKIDQSTSINEAIPLSMY